MYTLYTFLDWQVRMELLCCCDRMYWWAVSITAQFSPRGHRGRTCQRSVTLSWLTYHRTGAPVPWIGSLVSITTHTSISNYIIFLSYERWNSVIHKYILFYYLYSVLFVLLTFYPQALLTWHSLLSRALIGWSGESKYRTSSLSTESHNLAVTGKIEYRLHRY